MKLTKTELLDILLFDNNYLRKHQPDTYKLKCELMSEIDARIEEDNSIEITFVAN